jgi:hypothetical protein
LWSVEYDDGDAEDLDREELMEAISLNARIQLESSGTSKRTSEPTAAGLEEGNKRKKL